ncbi:MAG: hypothetical protein ACKO2T_26690 [Microcystis aeruginosa]
MVRSPKIDRWTSRSHLRERTLQDWRSHYKIGDRIFKVRSLSRLHSRSNDRVHWAVEVKDFRIEYLR